jgi:hypothetical protein
VKYAIFAIVFMLLARPVVPVASYIINYDYITTVLCVNKAKPVMHCNGKCHLMKELAKAAEKEKPLSDKKLAHQEAEILFYQPVTDYSFSVFIPSGKNNNPSIYSNLYIPVDQYSIFHPPLVA